MPPSSSLAAAAPIWTLTACCCFAVVRAIEVVGEAASKLSEEFRAAHPGIPWRAIVGMRNRLIHAYFDIDTQTVWETATQELPPILNQLRELAAAG